MVLSLIQRTVCNPLINLSFDMVKIKTTFSFGFCLEFQRVKETLRSISKVLRVATETIRTRYREIT